MSEERKIHMEKKNIVHTNDEILAAFEDNTLREKRKFGGVKMINQSKFAEIVAKYEEDIDSHDYRYFVPEVLRKCGAIALKKSEDLFGFTLKAVYANRDYRDEHYEIIDDVVFSTDKKELVRYSPEKIDESYVIPDYVETIRDGAFQGSEHLERVTISKNIHHIGSRAFADSFSLAEIVWDTPEATGSSYVFENCPKLKTVITDDVQKLFGYKCDNDGSPFINGACLMVDGEVCENLSIPDDADITLRAFQGCTSIKDIEFEENNKYIEKLLLSIVDNKGILI